MAVTEAAFHLEPMAIPSPAPAEQAGHQLGLEHPMPMALAAMAMVPEVAPAMPTAPVLAMAAMAMAMVPMLAVFRLVASEEVVSLLVALGDVGSRPVALEAHKPLHPPLGDQANAYTALQQLQLFATLVRMKTRLILFCT